MTEGDWMESRDRVAPIMREIARQAHAIQRNAALDADVVMIHPNDAKALMAAAEHHGMTGFVESDLWSVVMGLTAIASRDVKEGCPRVAVTASRAVSWGSGRTGRVWKEEHYVLA